MAEPGRVYDEDNEEPVTGPNLRKLEGGGESTPRRTDHLSAYKPPDEKSAVETASNRTKAAEKNGTGSAGLHAVPDAPSDQLGEGFNPSDEPTSTLGKIRKGLISLSANQRKKAGIFGGITGGIIGLITLIFFVLIPLKIEHIVSNLENRFFGSSHSALQSETQKLFDNYGKQILRGRKTCTGEITKACAPGLFDNGSPVKNLYRSWKQNNLETKLADKYGIEFKAEVKNGKYTYYIKTPGMTDPQVQGQVSEATLNSNSSDITHDFQQVDRTAIRDTMNQSFQDETLWNRVNLRFKVGRLLEEKYGIRRCILFCGLKDAKDTLVNNTVGQINSAQIYLIDRVITPRSEVLGKVLKCLMASSCDPAKTNPQDTCETGVSCEANGDPVSPIETDIQSTLQADAAQQGTEAATTLVDNYTATEALGGDEAAAIDTSLNNALVDATGEGVQKTVQQAANEGATTGVDDLIPVIGWIQLADQIVHYLESAKNVGPKLKKLAYITTAVAAVHLFMTYRTYADEVKSGRANATEVGSFTSQLGPGDHSLKNCMTPQGKPCPPDPEQGGTATAESTPLYSALIDNNPLPSSNTAAYLNNIAPTAFAQSSTTSPTAADTSSKYTCKDGNPIPGGKLICPEEKVGGCDTSSNQAFADGCAIGAGLHYILSLPQYQILYKAAYLWDHTIGYVVSFAFNLISKVVNAALWVADKGCGLTRHIPGTNTEIHAGPTDIILPGYCQEKAALVGIVQWVQKALVNWLIPDPFGSNMSGGRTFDMMAAGADVAGNDNAHNGLGGEQLTPKQSAEITNQQQDEALRMFKREPFFARIFDTSSDYSLITRLAMFMPISPKASFVAMISNPFSVISHGIGSVFSPTKVSAQVLPQGDPFGVTQYGYPLSDSDPGAVPNDPSGYWDQHCADNGGGTYSQLIGGTTTHNWNTTASNNLDQNGMPLNAPMYDSNGNPTSDATDPCLLIQAAVGSAGALFDQTLLTPDDLVNSNNATSQSNASIYVVGDSLSVGMQSAGLQAALSKNGWNTSKIEATVGDSVQGALPKVTADASNIGTSQAALVELGTNNGSDSQTTFSGRIQAMIQALRNANPTIQIYWMNTYSANNPNYAAINAAIQAQAANLHFYVIDWANEVLSNPGKYTFDAALGVHPQGSGYQNMTNFVAAQISPPLAQAAGNTNIVAQSLLATTPKKPSFFASLLTRIKEINQVVEFPIKQSTIGWKLY